MENDEVKTADEICHEVFAKAQDEKMSFKDAVVEAQEKLNEAGYDLEDLQ